MMLPALRRGFAVIRLIAHAGRGLTFSELKRGTTLPDPTLSKILTVLVEEDLLRKAEDGRRYELGFAYLATARLAIKQMPRGDLAQPIVEVLADRTGNSVAYFEREGGEVVLLAKAERTDSWHYADVMSRMPNVMTGTYGRVCLAYERTEAVRRFMKETTEKRPMTTRAFLKHLEAIREEGVFVGPCGHSTDNTRVICPVFVGPGGALAGALGVTVLQGKLSDNELDRFTRETSEAARQLTRRFGEYYGTGEADSVGETG